MLSLEFMSMLEYIKTCRLQTSDDIILLRNILYNKPNIEIFNLHLNILIKYDLYLLSKCNNLLPEEYTLDYMFSTNFMKISTDILFISQLNISSNKKTTEHNLYYYDKYRDYIGYFTNDKFYNVYSYCNKVIPASDLIRDFRICHKIVSNIVDNKLKSNVTIRLLYYMNMNISVNDLCFFLCNSLPVNYYDTHGVSLLCNFCINRKFDHAIKLIEYGCDINRSITLENKFWTILCHACDMNDIDLAIFALNNNIKIEDTESTRYQAFHICIEKGHDNIFNLLVRRNADLEVRGFENRTPLMTAVHHAKFYMIRLLLNCNVDLNKCDRNGDTALHNAINNKLGYSVIELLLYKGCNPNIFKNTYNNILLKIIHEDDIDYILLELILKYGGNPYRSVYIHNVITIINVDKINDSIFKKNYSPIFVACKCRNIRLLHILISRSIKYKCNYTNTLYLMFYCCYNGLSEILNILSAHKLDVHISNKVGVTPLHVAAYYGHYDIVEILLNLECDVYARDIYGKTPIYYANLNNYIDIVNIMS